MRLLVCLAEHAGEVVSIDDLLEQVWSGVIVSPDSVYQAVTSLRRVLGDDSKQPTYIATVPRLGYRMVASVGPWSEPSADQADAPRTSDREPPTGGRTLSGRPIRVKLAVVAAAMIGLALVAVFWLHGKAGNQGRAAVAAGAAPSPKAIAVLPFLDLTETMSEEPFADGMTEELIDKLSKVPGLQVPAPTSSFYFKGKHMPVSEIASKLGVAYVLDGSVRKSGDRVRVAARLVRANTGYVVWSETYDRAFDDILMVQDDIAGQVTKALSRSIEAK
jgi:transcriptional activator of cad operon